MLPRLKHTVTISSAAPVIGDDDLLRQILLRLPAKPLLQLSILLGLLAHRGSHRRRPRPSPATPCCLVPIQPFIFSFFTRTLIGADTAASPEISSSGYAMLDIWLALQLLPTVKDRPILPTELRLGLPGSQSPEQDSDLSQLSSGNLRRSPCFLWSLQKMESIHHHKRLLFQAVSLHEPTS
ncbi:unnamed protein product [Camellia sinensis]